MTVAAETSPGPVPGTRPPTAVDPPSSALAPFVNVTGHLSLSVDGLATNNPAGGPINVQKNPGATVRQALLFAASTGFTQYIPVNGDVTVDGSPVTWDSAHTIPTSISSYNVLADVTSMVKPKLDASPAGTTSFTVAEPTHTFQIDGEILAVIFDDPTVTVNKSITLLYGAQNTAGDSFNVALTQPINKTDPNQQLTFGLGISFGYQAPGALDQFSLIDVNGQRLSSSAGGQDDCDQKYAATPNFASCDNGALLTVGGLGDSTSNPADPNATPQLDCVPRCDDELYDLMPFVNNGDSSFTIHTLNPSNDDNIFFGWLLANPPATVSTPGCVSISVKQNVTDAKQTDIQASCLTAGEKVDVLLNTEAGGILVDQPTVDASGNVSETFTVPQNFNIPLSTGMGFDSVAVPVRQSTTYQLDVIGEKTADGGSLQVKANSSGGLNASAGKTVTTTGAGCAAASPPVLTALPLPGHLTTNNSRWIESQQTSQRVKLASANWYGAEEADFIPGGLYCQSRVTLAREIRDIKLNSVRLPWSNAMLEEDPGSCASSPTPFGQPCISPGLLIANPDLVGSDAIGVYRAVVQALAQHGVMVVLDNHTTDAQWAPGTTNGIWWGGVLWDDLVAPEVAQCPLPGDAYCWKKRIHLWQKDWINMVTLFQSEPNVVGVDLRNEPNDRFSYSGGPEGWCDIGTCPPCDTTTCATDGPVPAQPMQWSWGPSAAWAGNAILGTDPNLLIIVEGIDFSNDLTEVFHHWVSLDVSGRVVYSPHSYAKDTFDASTAYGSISQQADLFKALGDSWGYIVTQGKPFTAPVWVGEFGVCNTSDACTMAPVSPNALGDGNFRANFTAYLSTADFDWAYWPLNGTDSNGGPGAVDRTWFSQEPFGILNPSWSAPQQTGLLVMLPIACSQGPGC